MVTLVALAMPRCARRTQTARRPVLVGGGAGQAQQAGLDWFVGWINFLARSR